MRMRALGCIVAIVLLSSCGSTDTPSDDPGAGSDTAAVPESIAPRRHCVIAGALPDPTCTPGALNSDVTQATIKSTICKSGWTSTIRPPVSYTNGLKVQGIRDYGYSDRVLSHYEEDHLVPLELGGHPTDPSNLWPEPAAKPGFHEKDQVENRLKAEVCSGKLSLADAQHAISTNWMTAP